MGCQLLSLIFPAHTPVVALLTASILILQLETSDAIFVATGMEGDGEESAESTPTLMLPFPVIVPDECTLFTVLTRPLPDYALQHVFAQHGLVEWVCASTPLLGTCLPVLDQRSLAACRLMYICHCPGHHKLHSCDKAHRGACSTRFLKYCQFLNHPACKSPSDWDSIEDPPTSAII